MNGRMTDHCGEDGAGAFQKRNIGTERSGGRDRKRGALGGDRLKMSAVRGSRIIRHRTMMCATATATFRQIRFRVGESQRRDQ